MTPRAAHREAKEVSRLPTIHINGENREVDFEYDPTLVLPPDLITMGFADTVIPNLRLGHRVLDLGTGSGIFAVRLIMRLKQPAGLVVRLVDNDPVALATAATNARRAIHVCGFSDEQVRLEVVQSDWIAADLAEGNRYNFVYFNPPYLPNGEEVHGEAVSSPRTTMYAGESGLDGYAAVFPDIHLIMAHEGMFMVREPYACYLKLAEHSRMFDPPRESHSYVISLYHKLAGQRAWPVGMHYTFAEDRRIVKAGGGFIAQYFAPQASDTP